MLVDYSLHTAGSPEAKSHWDELFEEPKNTKSCQDFDPPVFSFIFFLNYQFLSTVTIQLSAMTYLLEYCLSTFYILQ